MNISITSIEALLYRADHRVGFLCEGHQYWTQVPSEALEGTLTALLNGELDIVPLDCPGADGQASLSWDRKEALEEIEQATSLVSGLRGAGEQVDLALQRLIDCAREAQGQRNA